MGEVNRGWILSVSSWGFILRRFIPTLCLGRHNPILLWEKCVETELEAGKSTGERTSE